MTEPEPAPNSPDSAFPETPWTVLVNARADNTLGSNALAELCRLYWFPVYAYIRRRGRSPHDAEDLTQSFFEGFLRRGDFAVADPARGKLRSYLATAVSHYLSQEHRKSVAAKRGGGALVFSIDAETAEGRYREDSGDDLSPEKLFERKWALEVLHHVMDDLKAEYERMEKADVFASLSGFLTGKPATENYAAAGDRCGLSSDAVKMAVHRMKKRFRNLLHRHIAAIVETPDEVEEEIQWMMAAFAS